MGDSMDVRGRQLLVGAASILLLLALVEIIELYRTRWPIPPLHLLLELGELALLFGATAALATALASRRRHGRVPFHRMTRRRAAGDVRPSPFVGDDQMELLQRLQFYGGAEPGHRVHRAWLKARCTTRLARHFEQVVSELKERGLIDDANDWLSLTARGNHEVERLLFLSPMSELTRP